MKNLRNEKDQNLAAELSHIIAERRGMEKREKELKAYFKEKAGDDIAIKAGDILILLTEKSRESLDRKLLTADFGAEKLAPYIKTTSYVQVDVKGA